jgi:hypothetical protein
VALCNVQIIDCSMPRLHVDDGIVSASPMYVVCRYLPSCRHQQRYSDSWSHEMRLLLESIRLCYHEPERSGFYDRVTQTRSGPIRVHAVVIISTAGLDQLVARRTKT